MSSRTQRKLRLSFERCQEKLWTLCLKSRNFEKIELISKNMYTVLVSFLLVSITLYEFIKKKKTQLTQNEMVRKFPPVNRSFWYRRKTVSNIFNFVLFYSWHLIYKMCYIWSTKVLICMYISSIFFGGRVGELICKVQVFVSVGPILVTLSWHCNVVVFFFFWKLISSMTINPLADGTWLKFKIRC